MAALKRAVIISGGTVDEEQARRVLEEPYTFLIGVDGGLSWLYEKKMAPTHIVGDFDSVPEKVLAYYRGRPEIPLREFNPVKDASDTEIAVRLALKLLGIRPDSEKAKRESQSVQSGGELILLGATGTRMDHIWANVQTLSIAAQAGVQAWILDGHNRIRLIDGETHLKREEAFGPYFSLFSLGGPVKHLYISGARYPLTDHTLYPYDSLCVSNQIAGNEAVISFPEGLVVLMETRD